MAGQRFSAAAPALHDGGTGQLWNRPAIPLGGKHAMGTSAEVGVSTGHAQGRIGVLDVQGRGSLACGADIDGADDDHGEGEDDRDGD